MLPTTPPRGDRHRLNTIKARREYQKWSKERQARLRKEAEEAARKHAEEAARRAEEERIAREQEELRKKQVIIPPTHRR